MSDMASWIRRGCKFSFPRMVAECVLGIHILVFLTSGHPVAIIGKENWQRGHRGRVTITSPCMGATCLATELVVRGNLPRAVIVSFSA